jgi:hypothetical protein
MAINAMALGLVIFSSASAHAEFVSIDLLAPGDGLVTRDTASGLDWLDLTFTIGVDPQDIWDGALGLADDGWRHATTAEVCDLLGALGTAPPTCPGAEYLDDYAGALALDLLGITIQRSQPYLDGTLYLDELWGVFDDGGALNPDLIGLAELSVDTHSTGWVNTFVGVYEDGGRIVSLSSDKGNFLVRPVPEPSTPVQLAAGVTMLAALSRLYRGGGRP